MAIRLSHEEIGNVSGFDGTRRGRFRLPSQEDVSGLGVTRDPGVQASPDDFGAQIARAQQEFGAAMQRFGQMAGELAERRQEPEDRAFLDAFDKQFMQRARQSAQDFAQVGTGTPATLDVALGKSATDLTAQLQKMGFRPSGRALRGAELITMRHKVDALSSAVSETNNGRVAFLADKLDASMAAAENEAAETGDAWAGLRSVYKASDVYTGIVDEPALIARATAAEKSVIRNSIETLYRQGREDEVDGVLELTHEYDAGFQNEMSELSGALADKRSFEDERTNWTAEGETFLTMFDRIANGTLTEDWLDANSDLIGGDFGNLIRGGPAVDASDAADPYWRESLYALALDDPEQAVFQGYHELSAGSLSRGSFAALNTIFRDSQTPEGQQRNRARRDMEAMLGPGKEDRFDVLRSFERFLAERPDASPQAMQEHAEKLAKPFRKSQTLRLEKPSFALSLDRKGIQDATRTTAERFRDGMMSAGEAAREARLLREWLEAVEPGE